MSLLAIVEEERLKAMHRMALGQMSPTTPLPSIQEALSKLDALQAQRTPHALDPSARAARIAFDRERTVLPGRLAMKAPTSGEWAATPAGTVKAATLGNRPGIRAYKV